MFINYIIMILYYLLFIYLSSIKVLKLQINLKKASFYLHRYNILYL